MWVESVNCSTCPWLVKKFDEKKAKKKRLLLRVKRTGAGKEDYELLPPKQ